MVNLVNRLLSIIKTRVQHPNKPENQRFVDYDHLEKLIQEIFPESLTYLEGTQLCIILFSFSFPNVEELALSKEELAILFSRLVSKKMISVEKSEYREIAKKLGADKFKVNTYDHWLAICLSILRFGQEAVNVSVRDKLISKIEHHPRASLRI